MIFTASDGAHRNIGMASYIIAKLVMGHLCEIIHQENFKEFNIKGCFDFTIEHDAVIPRFNDIGSTVGGSETFAASINGRVLSQSVLQIARTLDYL